MKYEIKLMRTTWQTGTATIDAVDEDQAHKVAASIREDAITRWHAPTGYSELVGVSRCDEPEPEGQTSGDSDFSSKRLPLAVHVALREVIDHFFQQEAFDFATSEHRYDHIFERLLMLSRWLHGPERIE